MSRNLIIFLIICGLGIGAVLVYAWNNMNSSSLNDKTQQLSQLSNSPSPTQEVKGVNFQQQATGQNNRSQNINSQNQQIATPTPFNSPAPTTPITQLQMKDEKVGTGEEVKNGDTVEVNYLGTFLDGTKFDSSYDRNQTFSFTVGAGNVIKGWDMGLIGMKTGGKRILVIPSDLAYGAAGAPGAIPPNTPLIFEIELVSIKP